MKGMIRAVTVVTVVAFLILGTAPMSARAQQRGNPQTIALDCEGMSLSVTVNGSSAAAHVIDGDGVLVAQGFVFELEADGVVIATDTVANGQKRGLQGRLLTCTFTQAFSAEEQAEIRAFFGLDAGVVISATVTVSALVPGAR